MCMAFVALLLAASFAGPPRCKGNPALVGQCFTIPGRLRARTMATRRSESGPLEPGGSSV